MSGPTLPRRFGRCRVERIEDLRDVQRMVASMRVALVELTPGSDETVEELDWPLHSVAEQRGGTLILVEHEIVRTLDDAARAASLASDALTRVDLLCSDEDADAAAVSLMEGVLRSIGGCVWEIDDRLFVAAPFNILDGPHGGGRGGFAGDRSPLRPIGPALSGAAALPIALD